MDITERYFPVLSNEEIEYCFACYHQGDQAMRDKIFYHNRGLVKSIVGRRFPYASTYDKEDLIVEGEIGLLHAIEKFDYQRGVKFSTFAAPCINNALNLFLKRKKISATIDDSLDEPCYENDDEPMLCTIPTDEESVEQRVERRDRYDRLFKVMNFVLTPREKAMLTLCYGFNGIPKGVEEIGKIFHLSKQRVSQINQKSLKKLKEALENPNLFTETKIFFTLDDILSGQDVCFQCLSLTELKIFKNYLLGIPYMQIANDEGVSYQSVVKKIRKILKICAEHMSENDYQELVHYQKTMKDSVKKIH